MDVIKVFTSNTHLFFLTVTPALQTLLAREGHWCWPGPHFAVEKRGPRFCLEHSRHQRERKGLSFETGAFLFPRSRTALLWLVTNTLPFTPEAIPLDSFHNKNKIKTNA